jgi:hypothetical protein
MRRCLPTPFLAGLCLVAASSTLWAQSAPEVKVTVEQRSLASASDLARVVLEKTFDGPSCGMEVAWGDGKADQVRLETRKPVTLEHRYAAPGAFAVVADGKIMVRGLNTAFPCRGAAQVFAMQVQGGGGSAVAQGNPAQAPVTVPVAPVRAAEAPAVVATPPVASPAATPVPAPSAVPAELAGLGDDAQGRRVALLVGNTKYQSTLGPLTNPTRDVRVMKDALQKVGFEVAVVEDTSKRGMQVAVRDFARSAQGAAVAFMYYSGHGIQSGGENYFLPVDASIEKEADLDVEAMSVSAVMRQIEEAQPRYSIVALDACRDNPVARKQKSGLQGLARVNQQPTSSFVAYATQAGATAADDGLFARSLAARLVQPGVGLRTVFDLVARDVANQSNNRQQPLRLDGLRNDIYLAGRAMPVAAPVVAPPVLPPLCRAQQGDALQACLKWQCMTEEGKNYAPACKGV